MSDAVEQTGEITAAMIEAGADVLRKTGLHEIYDWCPEDVVEDILKAALAARRVTNR